jgi:hypothetical protein
MAPRLALKAVDYSDSTGILSWLGQGFLADHVAGRFGNDITVVWPPANWIVKIHHSSTPWSHQH